MNVNSANFERDRCRCNSVQTIEELLCSVTTLQVKTATAVLILADRCAVNEDGEDEANIMRATAIKNYRKDARIIIQLLQYRNKVDSRLHCSQHMSHIIYTGL